MTDLERRAEEILERAKANAADPTVDRKIDARRAELTALSDDALIERADRCGTITHAQLTVLTRGSATGKAGTRRNVVSALARAEVLGEMARDAPACHFECYSVGICYASICTNMPIDAAVAHMNAHHPSGTTHGWKLADEPFRTGGENGRACDAEHAPGARHWLLVC